MRLLTFVPFLFVLPLGAIPLDLEPGEGPVRVEAPDGAVVHRVTDAGVVPPEWQVFHASFYA